ncbi:MAG: cell division protein FtsQ/DivIB, partial [Solirubrobacteraceae bacterium]
SNTVGRRGGRRRYRRRGAIRLPRPGPRALAALLALLVVVGGVYLWLRDSSLVAVQKVRVVGVSGPDAAQIRAALATAARNMTTLDVQMGQLQSAVRPYPVVKRLDVSTQFPHGMQIRVLEKVAVASVVAGGRRLPVSSDGTLLHGVTNVDALPIITLGVPPGGPRLSGYALSEVRLLAAAPYSLLSRIRTVTDGPAHGLTVALRNGPSVYFGSTGRLGAKWTAATAVLGSPDSAGAVYIDVTDPTRPAAGAGADSTAAATGGATAGATATTAVPGSTTG